MALPKRNGRPPRPGGRTANAPSNRNNPVVLTVAPSTVLPADAAAEIAGLPAALAALIAVDPVSGCWLWRGSVDKDGYGKYRGEPAHRVVYRLLIGPIPPGRELDHLCHTRDKSCPGGKTDSHRRCVRPTDLEPVTGLANSLRSRSFAAVNAAKTECHLGHPFDLYNCYWRPNGHRDCRICTARRQREYQTRKRAALATGAGLRQAA